MHTCACGPNVDLTAAWSTARYRVLSFWATPEMTYGHLLFAAGGTGYILVGIWFEERDLVAHFGDRYRDYRKKVGMLLPRFG